MMKHNSFLALCKYVSAALLVVGIPWLVHAQMGGGGMGGSGMGGGGMGMGGMPGGLTARDELIRQLAKTPVQWKRPSGEAPFWLKNGKEACESAERIRKQLNEVRTVKLENMPLEQVADLLKGDWGLQVDLNLQSLDDEGITKDVTISFQGEGPARELLRRAFEPLKLTYIVHENSIEIATTDAALSRPVLRYYDLGHVQSDSTNIEAIVATIEQSVEPETWNSMGGESNIMPIGQLLVVSTTEKAHLGIERLLSRLSATEPNAAGNNQDPNSVFNAFSN